MGIAYLQIVLACILWGSYGLFVQILPYSPEVIVFFRFFFTAVILVGYIFFAGRLADFQQTSWKKLIVLGVINTVSWLGLTKSILYTNVATGYILYYTAPCFVVILAPFYLKEPLERKSLVALACCFAGIISVMGFSEVALTGDNWNGSILGLGSGISFALYLLGLKSLPNSCLGLVSNIYVSATIAFVTFPMAFPSFHEISLMGVFILFVAALTIQVIGTTLYMIGLRNVKVQHAGILSYLEALFATVFATIFLHEHLSVNIVIGGLLILIGGVIITKVSKEDNSADSVSI